MILTRWFSCNDSHGPQTDQCHFAAPINSHSTSSHLQTEFTAGALAYGLIGIAASQASPTLPLPASLTNTRRSDGLGTTVAVLCLVCFVCLHILCVSIQPPLPTQTHHTWSWQLTHKGYFHTQQPPPWYKPGTIHPVNQQPLLFLPSYFFPQILSL